MREFEAYVTKEISGRQKLASFFLPPFFLP